MKKALQKTLTLGFALMLVFSISGFAAQNQYLLEFDGNDSYYVNDNNNGLDVNDDNAWTMECWVYPEEVPTSGTYPCIMDRKYSFSFYLRNTNDNCGLGIVALDGTSQGFTIEGTLTSGTNSMTINQWHHVAASFDGTTARLFIDGSIVGTSTDPDFDLDASISAINFGARYDGTYQRYIHAALDEIHYSKIARYVAAYSITTSTPPQTSDANSIFLYHMDEGSGTTIGDETTTFNASLRTSPNDATWRTWDYFGDDLPLPVELTSFKASSVNGKVQLNWTTASELNNQGFIIRRSAEKEGPYVDLDSYQSNVSLRGAGSVSHSSEYAYIDENVLVGETLWYTLVSVDINGVQESFDPVSVVVNKNNIHRQDGKTIPATYSLSQNYPNPFNPSTAINFNLPATHDQNAPVKLVIYDLQGRLVQTIFSGYMAAGSYQFTWNGKNTQGQRMASGVYIYNLETASFNMSRKMTLIQ